MVSGDPESALFPATYDVSCNSPQRLGDDTPTVAVWTTATPPEPVGRRHEVSEVNGAVVRDVGRIDSLTWEDASEKLNGLPFYFGFMSRADGTVECLGLQYAGLTPIHEHMAWVAAATQYDQFVWQICDAQDLIGPAPSDGEAFYVYKERVWAVDRDYDDDDRTAIVIDAYLTRQKRINRIRARVEANGTDHGSGRKALTSDVKTAVWRRDSGRCVQCGSQMALEFDHIIPVSMGGSDTERNIQLLCAPCNRAKGGNLA